ncbi:LysR substrate-binding domain-containing protein [Pararhodobacter sp.]|uniref:LysR substrate-binding domain-containing protein n=1 Tax=Pararhodobacter sp. TaxID=2127056 RepID=UPI002AFEA694|nr:LysR substrate-binding domain-containing protein [Pararhodobacter sp.]
MAGFRGAVSSLSALATFEAAARLVGFTRAAEELGVTQAAVSRQIKLLETELNTPLFIRGHRKVELTPAGLMLARALTGAFDQVAEAIDILRHPAAANTVTFGATLGFMHFWLLPRLPAFRAAHPEVQLRLVSQDSGFDMRRDPIDVLIHYGKVPIDGTRCLARLPDVVFPVASPRLAGLDRPLDQLPLIGCEWLEPSWLSWRRWAQLAGHPPLQKANSLRFSQYTDAIYAAVGGEGVALGWRSLIAPHLQDGRLVRLGNEQVTPEESHNLLVPTTRTQGRGARKLTAWLEEAFAAQQA